ncbi:hypothetical protein JCM19046_3490 [Bacillus sp. JCM 19046]|nr:hypothetical protein JCM19045_4285 [Bacillus sp. JCM 19045]GAF18881.1 hypothetical protein JCM19046_3490 [Bacillus sp. JCM 19046]
MKKVLSFIVAVVVAGVITTSSFDHLSGPNQPGTGSGPSLAPSHEKTSGPNQPGTGS